MNISCTRVSCKIVKSYKGEGLSNVECSQYVEKDYKTTFKCTGVRAYGEEGSKYWYLNNNSHDQYEQYLPSGIPYVKTLIKNGDINRLRDFLKMEIERRRAHVWYSGVNYNDLGSDILTGDRIENGQRNIIKHILGRLKSAISNASDYKEVAAKNQNSGVVNAGDLIDDDHLRLVEVDLFNSGNDCICYSDCTEFKLQQKKKPQRVSCGCVYW